MRKLMLAATSLTVMALAGVSPAHAGHHEGGHDMDKAKAESVEKLDIVATASANEDFSTLVAAIQAADLVEALQGDGPFTVFAPTNEAFAALPEGALEDLLKAENKEKLQAILQYHVVSGKIKAADIAEGSTDVGTLEGDTVAVVKSEAGVTVDGANVTATDIYTSNGVIHVIDKVIMPE